MQTININQIDFNNSFFHFSSKENLENIKQFGLKATIGDVSQIVSENDWMPVITNVDIIESVQDPVEAEGIIEVNDDDGKSYMFRGEINNNYVSFANKLWRVVRINGDKSIRLILNDSSSKSPYSSIYDDQKYAGFTYDNDHLCTINNPCLSNNGTNSTIKDY